VRLYHGVLDTLALIYCNPLIRTATSSCAQQVDPCFVDFLAHGRCSKDQRIKGARKNRLIIDCHFVSFEMEKDRNGSEMLKLQRKSVFDWNSRSIFFLGNWHVECQEFDAEVSTRDLLSAFFFFTCSIMCGFKGFQFPEVFFFCKRGEWRVWRVWERSHETACCLFDVRRCVKAVYSFHHWPGLSINICAQINVLVTDVCICMSRLDFLADGERCSRGRLISRPFFRKHS